MLEARSTWKRLRADRSGVVSFEYVVVTAFMVATVAAAYSTDAGDTIKSTLTGAIGAIIANVATSIGGG